jgi:xanthine dehydrogenase YagT iron-sulfur-binding subunit
MTDKRPLVLATLERWSATAEQQLAIRAQLRGLGAQLLVVTESGTTLIGPDDEPMQLASIPPQARAWGLELSVIDADGQTRWSQHIAELNEPPAEALLRALRSAVETMSGTGSGSSRRDLLIASLVASLALALTGCGTLRHAPAIEAALDPPVPHAPAPGTVPVTLKVNGAAYALELEPRVTLLDALRERLGLTGTKKGCDHGQCGACTVLVDGTRLNACLTLAVQHDGREVLTIEGLARGEALHPLQAAFIEHDALQCGYCTPGQILSALGLLSEGSSLDEAAVREGLSGNLCRCGAYSNIVAAVRAVQARI